MPAPQCHTLEIVPVTLNNIYERLRSPTRQGEELPDRTWQTAGQDGTAAVRSYKALARSLAATTINGWRNRNLCRNKQILWFRLERRLLGRACSNRQQQQGSRKYNRPRAASQLPRCVWVRINACTRTSPRNAWSGAGAGGFGPHSAPICTPL